MNTISPSKFRSDIYRILDQVVESGKPIFIKRKGQIIKIVPPENKGRFETLKKRNIFNEDPKNLVSGNWKDIWNPDSF